MSYLRSLFGVFVFSSLSISASTNPAWRAFSDDSPWNQRIAPHASIDPDSSALIEDFSSRGPLFINIKDWSISVYFVAADHTPKHDVSDSRPGIYGAGFEFPRAIPIPDDAVASPPIGDESDNHLAIVDRTKNLEWGMWAARRDSNGRWFTGLGAVTDLSGTGVAPPWFESTRELDSHRARASGFPLIAGLILLDEIKAGRIDHALVFAYDHCRSSFFIPPASTAQVTTPVIRNSSGIPMGGRIQLDPTWDVEHSGLSASAKIIARALQEYGAFCGDFAGANVIYVENSPAAVKAWEGVLNYEELANVFTPEMIRQRFRVIAMGNLMPGQNLELPPPYVLTFHVAGETSPAQIDQLTRTITLSAKTKNAAMGWSVHPRDARLSIDDKVLVNGAPLTLPNNSILTVSTADGRISRWNIVTR